MNPTTETFTFDLTGLCEKVAERLRQQGSEHPVAAAAALAARGLSGLDPDDFADQVGLPAADIVSAESGQTPFGDLPAPIGARLEAHPGIDLLALADLDCHSGAVHDMWKETEEEQR